MSEMTKSVIYILVAALSIGAAVISRPREVKFSQDAVVGKPLFQEFKDPDSARSLKITRYDEDLAKLAEFEVRQMNGQWVLPSNSNYPADAQNRVRDAATQFIGLEAIGLLSNDESSHAEYGVLEPNDENRRTAAKGVGTLLEMEDGKGERYRLVVGAEVKGSQGQRYVRVLGKNAVYVAKLDLAKFPAKFEEWINRDLLDVSSLDIAKLVLNDYSVGLSSGGGGVVNVNYDQRFSLAVHENQGKWELDELREFDGRELKPAKLAEGETLNAERLNGLRDALDELVIVDVDRKPAGLKEDLSADADFASKRENFESLAERGFYPVPMPPNNEYQLLSSDGEVIVQLKDGVEYVLRFGEVSGADEQGQGNAQLNRYLFVTARVNKDLIPLPELETLPGEAPTTPGTPESTAAPATEGTAPAAETPATSPADGNAAAQPEATTNPPASEGAPAEPAAEPAGGSDAATEAGAAPESGTADSAGGDAAPTEPETNQSSARQPAWTTKPVAAQEGGAPPTSSPAADSATGSTAAAPASDTGAAPATGGSAAESPAGATTAVDAERVRIEKENKRKMDEYNEKLNKAEMKKNDLNFRFADWYYVISEDVYKKIHLSRSDVIQLSGQATDGVGAAKDLLEEVGGLPDGAGAPADQ